MSEKKKEDRRIQRTKSSLRQALRELAKEKGYSDVTIEDITNRAKLGRTTFYLHYQDKEDLLLEGIEEQLSDWVNEIIQRPLILWFKESNGKLIKSIFQTVFETVKNNSDVFTIATHDQSSKIYDRFRVILGEAVTKLVEENPWAKERVSEVSMPISYLADYFCGAIWASIVWWGAHDFSPSPAEMANYFRLLYFPGMLSALNARNIPGLMDAITTK
jgi:Transcriptional regulator